MERVVTNATALVTVRGDETAIVAAATNVKEDGLTPFDAIHLVMADGDRIVSSDDSDDDLAPRLDCRARQSE